MTNSQRRVAIYVRQSLDVQEGIDRQLERCRALVESRGWTLVKVFQDNAVSASKNRDTAEWGSLLQMAREGAIDTVVATKLDRIARQVRDVLDLSDLGLGIATAEGDIDTTTAMGKFQAHLLAALAELEASRKGERHREAHADRAQKGIPRLTKRAYGWKAGGIELEPREAEHLRIAIRNIIAGGSIRGEAARMTAAGETTPVYRSGSGGKPWDARGLTSVLDRPRIAGILVYGGIEMEESQIEPVVSREEWEEYRAIRKDPSRLTRRPGRTPLKHWLSGLAECGSCGGPMGATTIAGRNGKRYDYYKCKTPEAGHVAIAAGVLERSVRAQVFAQILGRRGEVGDDTRIRDARARVADLVDVIGRATEASLRGSSASRGAADKVRRESEAELEEAQRELDALLAAGDAETWSDIAEIYFGSDDGMLGDAFATFSARWDETPVERRRDITRRLIRVKVLRDGTPREIVKVEPGRVWTEVEPAHGADRIVVTVK